MKIDSSTGNEKDLAIFIHEYLDDLGLSPWLKEHESIVNVGIDAGSFVVTTHLDTIQNRCMCHVSERIIKGTGACDAKGCIASILLFLERMVQEDMDVDISIAFLSDEEEGGMGSELYLKDYNPSMGVVMEPTDLKLCWYHAGSIEILFGIRGKESHGSYHESGKNPLEMVWDMMNALKRSSCANTRGPFFSSSVSLQELICENPFYLVPGYCRGRIEVRLLPEQRIDAVISELKEIMEAYCTDLEFIDVWEGYKLKETDEVVFVAKKAMEMTGLSGEDGMRSWTDGMVFNKYGIKTVVFGPGNLEVAHTTEESVMTCDILRAAEFLFHLDEVVKRTTKKDGKN